MAEPITIEQLKNASLDAESLARAVNGDEHTDVHTRLGQHYPSLKKLLKLSNDYILRTGATSNTIVGLTTASGNARTQTAKNSDIISVKDFGAVGDGSADDTAAFNAAKNSGRLVYIPDGTYKLNHNILYNNFFGSQNVQFNQSVATMHNITATKNEITGMELIAHRGFVLQVPQNTIIAMSSALRSGADSLECDVQVTADGVCVLYHDTEVDWLTSGTGQIKHKSHTEVRTLRFTVLQNTMYATEYIPTFDDFVNFAKKKNVKIYPEIKEYRSINDISLMLNIVKKYNMQEQCVFQSFRMSDLEHLRSLDVDVGIGLLGGGVPNHDTLQKLSHMGNAFLLWNYFDVLNNPHIVQLAKQYNISVGVWTCNKRADADELMRIGVHYIMSDVNLKVN